MATWGNRRGKKANTLALPPAPQLCPRLHMRALEPRILLDAAAVETALDAAGDAVHSSLADAYLAAHLPEETPSNDTNDLNSPTETDHFFAENADDTQTDQLKQIAFVAADVPDILTLVATLPADAEIVLLDNTRDGVEQIAEFLDGRSGIDAIHLISHGEAGVLKLGDTELNAQTMTHDYRSQLAKIGEALTLDADIIVYGCDFASGETGREAANLLASLINADLAASTDATGHSSLGGDWDLEFKTGAIEAEAFDASNAWLGLLPTTTLESHEVTLAQVDHDERVGSNRIVGQTFIHGSPGSQYEVSQVDLVLGVSNNPDVQNITVTIRDSPTGPVLASGTMSSASLTSTSSWQSIALDSPVTLDSGTDYVFMVETDESSSGGGGGTVTLAVEHDDFYAGGVAIDRHGDPRPDHYTLFRLIGTENSAPTITSYGGIGWAFTNMDENQTFVTTVTATDPDLPADTLTYSITGGFDAAAFTIDPNTGDLSFVAAPDFENPTDVVFTNGIYTVDVEVSDGRGGTDSQTISVTVVDVDETNDAPTGSTPDVTTPEDTPVNGTITMTDPDVGDTPEATLDIGPSNGFVVVNLDGTYTYTPNLNYVGSDSFTVTVTDDDGLTDTVTVNVTVSPLNDAPSVTAPAVTTPEDTPVNGVVTMSDPDTGDTPEATLGTGPSNGSVVVNLDGTYTYTPAPDYAGPDSFTVVVTDDAGLTDTVTINVTVTPVNDAPVAYNDSVNVPESTATPLGLTLPTDIDDVAANLTITVNQAPTAAQGTLSYTLDGGGTANAITATTMSITELASLIFTPVNSYTGPVDDFTYTVTDDDGLSDAGSNGVVSFIIGGINDAPDAYSDNVNVTEDTATLLSPTLPTDIDDVAANLTITANQVPLTTQGTLSYTLDGGGIANVVVGTAMSTTELATLTFTPTLNYAGSVNSFTYRVTDDDGASDAGSDGSVSIIMVPVNDAPSGSTPAVTTPEDTPVNGIVTMSDPDAGDTPEATLGTGPSNGSVVVNLNGTYTYTPDPDHAGPDSFTIIVTDDAGLTDTVTVNVTVNSLNDAPTGSAPLITTPEDTPVGGTVTMSDPDSGDTPEATLGTGPANGSVVVNLDGTYTYTPDPDYAGPDSFTVIVTDDAGLTDIVTVNVAVTPVNDAPTGTAPPVTTPEDTPVNGTIAMPDPDTGDTPEATLGTGPANGSVVVNLDGTYTYTPDPDYAGPDSFTVVVTDDGGLTDTVTVNVTVTPVNDAPTGSTPAVTTPEDTPVSGTVTMSDPDAGDTPETTLGTAPANGSVIVNLDGTYTYTPNPNYSGPDNFTVIVTDDAGLTDMVTVNVTIAPVNDAPTGSAPTVTTPEDTPVSGTVTISDLDVGDTPEATLGTGPANGSVILNLDGTYTYTPNQNYAGPDSFSVVVTDDAGLTDTVNVNVTVASVNDAPTGTAPAVITPEDIAVSSTVTMSDPDAGDTPEASLGAGPSNGSAIVNPDGSYTYTSNANYSGADSFTVVLTDDSGLTDTVTVNVTVTPVNDAPVGSAPPVTTLEDTPVGGAVTMTDSDTGDTPEATLGTGPSNGSAVVNLDGTYTYTPDPDYAGPDSFTVVVSDDAGLTDTVTVNVTVTSANDAPVATGGSVSILPGYSHVFTIADFEFNDAENDALQSVTLSNVNLAGGTLTYSNGTISVANGMTITRADLADLTFAPATGGAAQTSFDYTVNDSDFGIVSASMTMMMVQPSDPESPFTESDTPDDTGNQLESDEPETGDDDPLFDPIELDGTSGTTAPPELPVSSPPIAVVVQPGVPPVALPVEDAEEPLSLDILPIAPDSDTQPPEKLTSSPEPQEQPKTDYRFVPVNRQVFSNDLKQSGEEVREYGEFLGTDAAKVTFAFSSLLTVGGASFVLRGGALAAALMSAAPAWGRYDPISIVTGRKDENEDEEESDADNMLEFIESARARVKEESFL